MCFQENKGERKCHDDTSLTPLHSPSKPAKECQRAELMAEKNKAWSPAQNGKAKRQRNEHDDVSQACARRLSYKKNMEEGSAKMRPKHASGLSQWPTNMRHGHLHSMAKPKLPVRDHNSQALVHCLLK